MADKIPQTPVSQGYSGPVKDEMTHRILVTAIVTKIRRAANSELGDLMRRMGYTRKQILQFSAEILNEVHQNLQYQIQAEIVEIKNKEEKENE